MKRLGPEEVSCHVYSFKEGLLSKLAHDLKLEVTRLSVELGDDGLPTLAIFDLTSLSLVCQMHDGAEQTGTFSASDTSKIESNAKDDVLDVRHHPEARFSFDAVIPEGDHHRIKGTLTLHGRSRAIETTSKKQGDRHMAEVRLHQPDFGIKPFSAMLGALKVRPDVLVRVSIRSP